MPVIRLHPPFDHGAALRVPPAHDQKNWAVLWHWLGEDAQSVAEAGAAVQVRTPEGPVVAHCGDWIVLSHSGAFHVAHTLRPLDS
ncbi:hypothetical protein [Phenylobacterium sp.]|uniref:hypothetical protein n=1 Tax=Phenylobacterium sp. TaxID=1871053 RepID=UPI003D2C344F